MWCALAILVAGLSGSYAATIGDATTMTPVVINQTFTEFPANFTKFRGFDETWAQNLTVVDYFIQVIRGEVFGARHCKKDHQCGAGMRCNTLFGWCAPWEAPNNWSEWGNNCTMNDDCGDLYYCLTGRCRFAGPQMCQTNMNCASGIANYTFDCVDTEDLEKHFLAKELGRNSELDLKPHKKHHEVEIESEELEKFGPTAEGDHLTHGKRCWARCNVDFDCWALRFPESVLKENFGCCNGYCTRKQSCVSIPSTFLNATVVA